MGHYDQTSMGGSHEAFVSTDWTIVQEIAGGSRTHSAVLLNDLLKRYWKPVYCFLRQKGHDYEQAKDLTQGFFQEVVLGRDLIQRADRSRGRFRTFLLAALEQYVAGVHRKEAALKRIPASSLIHIDQLERHELPEPIAEFTPEQSFNYAWISQLLDELIEEVKARCRADGMTVHWQVFRDRVLGPIMENSPAPSMAEVCSKHGIEDQKKAFNMIVTVNRRFQATLRRHLRRSVASDDEVEDELHELMQIYSRKGAE